MVRKQMNCAVAQRRVGEEGKAMGKDRIRMGEIRSWSGRFRLPPKIWSRMSLMSLSTLPAMLLMASPACLAAEFARLAAEREMACSKYQAVHQGGWRAVTVAAHSHFYRFAAGTSCIRQ